MSTSQAEREIEEARARAADSRRRADELGASSFPASDPPACWTWDVARTPPPAADARRAEHLVDPGPRP